MQSKRRVKVTIEGRDYTIIGRQSAQHIEAVVEIVNSQLKQLSQLDRRLSSEDKALLMAVNAVSDQLIKEQKIMELEHALAEYSDMNSAGPEPNPTEESQKFDRTIPFHHG
ncbi:cell division protein ZapA [Ignavigranum ruoffiae]|uniref:cell division protein ZapA n=1 Tax=Ignavigranum ruoffiae TaxID=89093 RepID=UPI002353D073|nr:cell division protein ZapA [Ignavigranum ruoffiae]